MSWRRIPSLASAERGDDCQYLARESEPSRPLPPATRGSSFTGDLGGRRSCARLETTAPRAAAASDLGLGSRAADPALPWAPSRRSRRDARERASVKRSSRGFTPPPRPELRQEPGTNGFVHGDRSRRARIRPRRRSEVRPGCLSASSSSRTKLASYNELAGPRVRVALLLAERELLAAQRLRE